MLTYSLKIMSNQEGRCDYHSSALRLTIFDRLYRAVIVATYIHTRRRDFYMLDARLEIETYRHLYARIAKLQGHFVLIWIRLSLVEKAAIAVCVDKNFCA